MKPYWICAGVLLATSGIACAETKTGQTASIAIGGREGKLFGKDGRIGQDANYPVWRAGANEATALHTDADLDIGGLAVPKGDYTLFVNLANPASWEPIGTMRTGPSPMPY